MKSQEQKDRIVFLYTRLPDYFFQCVKCFSDKYNLHCTIIRYSSDINAPYKIQSASKVNIIDKTQFNSKESLFSYLSELNIKLLYLSGWGDKEYNHIARKFKTKIPVVLGLDNPWTSSLRQKLATFFAKIYLKKHFNKVWVAGSSQATYAIKLGFSIKDIIYNLYSADTDKFTYDPSRKVNFKIIYVGRFVKYKNPVFLAQTFDKLKRKGFLKKWSLDLFGNGPELDKILEFKNNSIRVQNFIDPNELQEKIKSYDVFCLPSKDEHWGVAVHEAICSGLVLLNSNSVYANTEFLISGYNGYSYDINNVKEFEKALIKLDDLNEEQLQKMKRNSVTLSNRIKKETWAANLMSLLEGE